MTYSTFVCQLTIEILISAPGRRTSLLITKGRDLCAHSWDIEPQLLLSCRYGNWQLITISTFMPDVRVRADVIFGTYGLDACVNV
jgi:hypothetical protein